MIYTEKPWHQSTTVWLNVIAILVAAIGVILEQAAVLDLTSQVVAYFTITVGVLNAIVRVLMTNQPISGTPAAAKLRRELRELQQQA